MSWYFLLKKTLYRQRQTCESTFSKKKMLVLCLSRVSCVCFSRYRFSCHVVPFPLFRPPLTHVYEKQLFLDTILLKKTLYRQRQTCESTFSKKNMLVLYLSRVYRIFFLGTHSRLMVHFLYRLILCLVLLGFSCLMFFPFFCSLSISFCVFLVFLVFFSRYPFSCQVVPFPLFRPSLTCVYEKQLCLDTFCWKKHCIGNVRHASVHFSPKMVLIPQKCTGTFLTFYLLMYRYIFDVQKRPKCTIHFCRSPPLKGWGCESSLKQKWYMIITIWYSYQPIYFSGDIAGTFEFEHIWLSHLSRLSLRLESF